MRLGFFARKSTPLLLRISIPEEDLETNLLTADFSICPVDISISKNSDMQIELMIASGTFLGLVSANLIRYSLTPIDSASCFLDRPSLFLVSHSRSATLGPSIRCSWITVFDSGLLGESSSSMISASILRIGVRGHLVIAYALPRSSVSSSPIWRGGPVFCIGRVRREIFVGI